MIRLIIASVIGLAVLGVAGIVLAARASERRHQRAVGAAPLPHRIPARVTAPNDALLDGDLGNDTLAMVCRRCTTGHGRCSCAGHCGRQTCRGGAVVTDLASALERITREDPRG